MAGLDPIRVVLCDSHTLFRRGLLVVLEREPDIEVVGEAVYKDDLVDLVVSTRPDVTVVGLGGTGPHVIGVLTRSLPGLRIMALSVADDEDTIGDEALAAVGNGAVGHLVKEGAVSVFAHTVRLVHAGDPPVSGPLSARLLELEQQTGEIWTGHERRVFQVIAQTGSVERTATNLGVDSRVVRGLVRNGMARFHRRLAQERAAAAAPASLAAP
ncbi:MAG: response regulator transcription factor [Actinomycetia bacterium]|nr:response regulator transcription factor [Actinomycetes bacterium]MCP3912242.1 response regulator transcription factor [Actinomycetes bacterium]MCP4088027.1 response regulator transcription factor [Actinomycetes bacterium]